MDLTFMVAVQLESGQQSMDSSAWFLALSLQGHVIWGTGGLNSLNLKPSYVKWR